jgi:class 3 adenylate cyclase
MTRHDWEDARDLFLQAEKDKALSAPDLEMLGEAEFWSGHPQQRIDALERAYRAYVESGAPAKAAAVALQLSEFAFARQAMAIANGWMSRAQHLLDGEPISAAHAYLAMFNAFLTLYTGDVDGAMEAAEQAMELAKQSGDRDVDALARNLKGRALLRKGEIAAGLALIDESTVAAVGGELKAWATANVYCGTIDACRDLADWKRAAEWTDEADREMQRQRIRGYPGVCRVHRAEIKRIRGAWPEAEEEARQACVELEQFGLMAGLGWGQYEIGEIRLRMGDFTAAEESFQRAYEHARDPEPGMSLLRLARGDATGAARSIKRALSTVDRSTEALAGDSPFDPLGRSHLLPAQVRIALAAGDLATAEAAATELEATANQFGSTAIHADAATARGSVLLATGDASAAVGHLLRSQRLWQTVGAPYEAAQVRMLLADAYRALGDEVAALQELEAARSTFERLKAIPDLQNTDGKIEALGAAGGAPAGERQMRTFMFTDIVSSTDLLEAIGDEAWEELIGWHDATLRSLFARHGGVEISHTGDGFFVAFDEARAAVESAISIQRTLNAHRKEQGFAPWVRIGLHTAEATRVGTNYRGKAVHVAARVAALAERDEILVSKDALQAAGTLPFSASELRTVSLKGIKESVEVISVSWQRNTA